MTVFSYRSSIFLLGLACLAVPGRSLPEDGGGKSIATESVTGVTWEWIGTTTPNHRIEVSTPGRYTIRFKSNGEAQIRYDCNHGGGLYEIANGNLSFTEPLTFTRIRCGEGSQSFSYRQQLGAVISYYTRRGDLYLGLLDDTGTMRFRKAGAD